MKNGLLTIAILAIAATAQAGNFQRDLLDLHNAWRAANDIPPMRLNRELQNAAEAFASQSDPVVSPEKYGYTGMAHFSSMGSSGKGRLVPEYVFWYFLTYDPYGNDWYLRQIRNPEHVDFGAAVGTLTAQDGTRWKFAIVIYGHGE